MIYGGSLMSNFGGSMMSKDKDMTKDVILSEIHKILDRSPEVLVETLNKSGVATSKNISKRDLIHEVVEALYSNEKFKQNISIVIVEGNKDKYHNADGALMGKLQGLFGGASSGGDGSTPSVGGAGAPQVTVGSDPVSAVAGAIGSIFSFGKSFKDAKNQKEADKAKLRLALLSDTDKKKTNYTPIIIIVSVLLVGGLIAYGSLKSSK